MKRKVYGSKFLKEAQAKRIAELEHRVEYYEKTRDLALKVADERYDRITELDAGIEAQAGQIAWYKKAIKLLRAKINQHHDRYWEGRWRTEKAENEALAKRIAELEEENAKLREVPPTVDAVMAAIEQIIQPAKSEEVYTFRHAADEDFYRTCGEYLRARAALGGSNGR